MARRKFSKATLTTAQSAPQMGPNTKPDGSTLALTSFPIKAHSEGESLIAFWGSPDQEEGKSVYRLVEPGKLEVIDAVRQKDGTWKEFGRFVVQRQ